MRRFLMPLLAAVLLSARVASADDAEALIARGLELREKGRDEEALGLFRQAQLTAPSPRARAQVALAEQALGLWVLAETDLVAALAAESDPWIGKNKGALEGALVVIRKHVGSLEVRGADRADVYIDGVKIGTGAGPYRVEAGRRVLEVRAPGKLSTSRAFELSPGGTARETVTLVAAPAPLRTEVAVAPGGGGGDPGSSQRLLGWVFVGVGAVVLATGGASLLVRKGYVDDYNASCPGVGVEQSPACQDQIGSARTWLTIAIVTLIAGGAVVVGGGIIAATAPSRTKTGFACGPLGCAGTF